jgi:L-fuconolactonase
MGQAGSSGMTIVDAQVHIWGANTPQRPWPKRGHPHRAEPMGAAELIGMMDNAGVDKVVIVPPSWEGDYNDVALAAVQAYPGRFAVMGRLDPTLPSSRGKLATWRKQPGMLGLRYNVYSPALLPWLADGHMDWVWKEAEQHHVPLYVLVTHAMLPIIDKVAERHPGLKLVLDHMCMTGDKRDEAAFSEFDQIIRIAKRPNVAAKMSAFPTYSTEPYPCRNLHPYIRKAFDAFGPRRLFWGTDITRSRLTYRQHITLFSEELPWLKGEDLSWVMGRGVCEWLGWKTA